MRDSHTLMNQQTPTYPSNCLKFLNDPLAGVEAISAQVRLNIIVVGAGLGGLSTAIALATSGHTVTVYEQAQKLEEVVTLPVRC
jgi:salicylate hydroxylase